MIDIIGILFCTFALTTFVIGLIELLEDNDLNVDKEDYYVKLNNRNFGRRFKNND